MAATFYPWPLWRPKAQVISLSRSLPDCFGSLHLGSQQRLLPPERSSPYAYHTDCSLFTTRYHKAYKLRSR